MQPVKPQPPKELFKGIAGLIIISVVVYKACTGDFGKTDVSKEEQPQQIIKEHPPVLITAQKLNQYYQDNEVSADAEFKGRKVRVAGIVTSINKDAFDNIYVDLSSGETFQGVHCRDVPEGIAARLSKGQKVIINGTISGMVMGSVFLDKCDKCEQIR